MRALYFGTYDRGHPRNVNAIAAMRATGIDVEERHASVRRGGWLGALNVVVAETKLFVSRPSAFDVVIVGYPGHFDVPRARRLAGGRALVFDAVLSLENELVEVRRRIGARSTTARVLRAVDFQALRLPDLVVCGTRVEADYLEERGARRTEAIFLGADEGLFSETWAPAYPFSALYVADPSHDVVDEAIGMAGVPVDVLDAGDLREDDAGIRFGHAGIVLGSFRESRAIPPSVFAALATGVPVITADTPAACELLADGDSAVLVPPDDPQALASAIALLAADEPLRARIAAGGRSAFEEHASRRVLGERWHAALHGNALRQEIRAERD
ncbi:MAG: glycosyltransferase [Gaiellaceae bacterium]